ncbi:MAG: T9SS type A sorting domain-containing protein [Cytophagales bacterium]
MFLETGFYEKYLWSNGDTTQKIEISSPGQYYVSVYDQLNNISTSDTIYISNVSPPQYTLNVKNITSDHSSSIEVIGLDTLYNYYVSLDNGPFIRNNLFIPNISSGSHQITVRDINGCESSQLFEIINIVKNENNPDFNNKSIARKWIEVLLEAIRNDLARPPIHARNLFHLSSIMYDALVIDKKVNQNIEISPFLLNNTINEESFVFDFPQPNNDQEYIEKVISYSAYNFIRHRFKNSVGIVETYKMIDSLMVSLDYDINYNKLDYLSGDPKSIGNYLAELYIDYGFVDNSNEINDYSSNYYKPINPPLDLSKSGNPDIIDPNRWQPLNILNFIDQSGNLIEGIPEFISPEWGNVLPFALSEEDLVLKVRDDDIYKVYHDPGVPPLLDTIGQGELDSLFKSSFSMVSIWGSHLDKDDGILWDISPNSIGNLESYPENILEFHSLYDYFNGGDVSTGFDINPFTNQKYEEQIVPRGDYTRVLAEFWADGPDSETPPGHWFVILNEVNDDNNLVKRFEGEGEELSDLEWDIKSYFLLGGAMHDVAISAWGIKGYYDYPRPISVIRYLSEKGQSSYPDSINYNPNGIKLIDNYIETVGPQDPLLGDNNENLGKIKLYTWKGFTDNSVSEKEEKGSGWILAEQWWPYQRPSFVTPPFAGYVSGHSTYSRAASVILEKITGSKFFPGGIGEFEISKNDFLVFENGPSVDMKLQWATYKDAADQCSLSRIWGGIHPYIDDIPGRKIGTEIGFDAFEYGKSLFEEINMITKSYENNLNNLKVYPNPVTANNYMTIVNETDKKIKKISLINFLGKTVFDQNVNIDSKKNRLNINKLPHGIYLLRIMFSDDTMKTTKIVISR